MVVLGLYFDCVGSLFHKKLSPYFYAWRIDDSPQYIIGAWHCFNLPSWVIFGDMTKIEVREEKRSSTQSPDRELTEKSALTTGVGGEDWCERLV